MATTTDENEPQTARATGSALPPMPVVYERRPDSYLNPEHYSESDVDYARNNLNAVLWFLDNAATIRALLPNVKIVGP